MKCDTGTLIEEFSDFLRVQRSASPNTLQSYLADVRQFFDWRDEKIVDLAEINERILRGYFDALTKKDISVRSVQFIKIMRRRIRFRNLKLLVFRWLCPSRSL